MTLAELQEDLALHEGSSLAARLHDQPWADALHTVPRDQRTAWRFRIDDKRYFDAIPLYDSIGVQTVFMSTGGHSLATWNGDPLEVGQLARQMCEDADPNLPAPLRSTVVWGW
ncbi:hypothetical protein JNJ66_05835 [Candidatus Saccharibacteria bacterium]|nr:hypothetical protein [Candidatus Saccharibacteria bacterium]